MTYEIKANEKFGSIEVFFEGKPGEKVRDALKALRFRWNPRRLCWYGFAELEEVQKACKGAKVDKVTKEVKKDDPGKDAQKALFEKYMNIIKTEVWEGSERMQEYARKKTQYIVELKNGDIIAIDKPTIETHFCFGYGFNGVSYGDDEEAYKAMRNAETNENYFLEENLKGINETIKDLLNNDLECYTYTHYSGQPDESKLKGYSVVRIANNPEWNPVYWSNLRDIKKLDIEDRERIAAGYEIVKKDFEKRLHTYLKKYGLSKLKTWTYLRD